MVDWEVASKSDCAEIFWVAASNLFGAVVPCWQQGPHTHGYPTASFPRKRESSRNVFSTSDHSLSRSDDLRRMHSVAPDISLRLVMAFQATVPQSAVDNWVRFLDYGGLLPKVVAISDAVQCLASLRIVLSRFGAALWGKWRAVACAFFVASLASAAYLESRGYSNGS